MMYCKTCGAENGDNSVFCFSCGNRIKTVMNETASIGSEGPIIEKLEGFSFSHLLADVFSRHSVQEIEDSFCVGTSGTIPGIEEVDTDWPRPWLFFRALLGSLILYALFSISWTLFQNPNLIPGMMLVGTIAFPIATVIFFLEVNVRKNISMYQLIRLIMLGGVISLFISLVLFELPLSELGWMGASVAGLIEEPGKLLALLIVARAPQFKYKLNGLVMGAAVGAGFAMFESMGYAMQTLIGQVVHNESFLVQIIGPEQTPVDAMIEIVKLRGVLSPLAHIIWTAICGAAIWRVKGGKPFAFDMMMDGRFWKLFIIPVTLHAIWNSELDLPYYLKYIILGAIGWAIVLALIQEGLKELRREKKCKLEANANKREILCPCCGCAYEYDPKLVGRQVQCSSCNEKFLFK